MADARGLREAGAEAALRFSSRHPEQLSDLLKLVANPNTRTWLQGQLQPRIRSRLARLNPDLIGLALLAQARRAYLLNQESDSSTSEEVGGAPIPLALFSKSLSSQVLLRQGFWGLEKDFLLEY